jgi:hypothetical protein
MRKFEMDGQEYEIRFKHEIHDRKTEWHWVDAFMGTAKTYARTTCWIKLGDTVVAQGVADCSIEDNFSREKGRKIALERAMKAARWDKSLRTVVWGKVYFDRFDKGFAKNGNTLVTI